MFLEVFAAFDKLAVNAFEVDAIDCVPAKISEEESNFQAVIENLCVHWQQSDASNHKKFSCDFITKVTGQLFIMQNIDQVAQLA